MRIEYNLPFDDEDIKAGKKYFIDFERCIESVTIPDSEPNSRMSPLTCTFDQSFKGRSAGINLVTYRHICKGIQERVQP